MIRTIVGALMILSVSHFSALAENGLVSVKPISEQPGDTGDGFVFPHEKEKDKNRKSLSGIACPNMAGTERVCLAVFDEGTEARYLVVRPDDYSADNENVFLISGNDELDAEAAATDGKYYYVTGSHSSMRNECKEAPGRRWVIRFQVDGSSGRALREPTADPAGKLAGYEKTDRLWAIMKDQPDLRRSAKKTAECPNLGDMAAIDIEGLAIRNNRLYFGFRGPTDNKEASVGKDAVKIEAKILAVDAQALFDGGDVNAKLLTLTVGENRGIRDLYATTDGILVLAGPDDDDAHKATKWIVEHWDGKETTDRVIKPRQLAELDLTAVKKRSCDNAKEYGQKPEAMTVLNEAPGAPYQLLILSDGMCDGGPLRFIIPR